VNEYENDDMRCSTCGNELCWKECLVCDGMGWMNESTACPRCDGEGGKWVCDCDQETESENSA